MWWACHGVPPLRVSAIHGPANSTSVSSTTHTNVTASDVLAISSATQPAWAIRIALM